MHGGLHSTGGGFGGALGIRYRRIKSTKSTNQIDESTDKSTNRHRDIVNDIATSPNATSPDAFSAKAVPLPGADVA
ncbi:hypothetical protein [Paraburkholderia sp. J41]|uniref:hypothetical protein n=1 Tax=Paraburkholderia sp. J41 TaxID=2805433 RepID=UPI002AC36444|nr:hypothetical protein [Paraburkholderia sp. J41]